MRRTDRGGSTVGISAAAFRGRSAAVPIAGSVASGILSLGAAGDAAQAELVWWLIGAPDDGVVSIDLSWPDLGLAEHTDLTLRSPSLVFSPDGRPLLTEQVGGVGGKEPGSHASGPPLAGELGCVVASSLLVGERDNVAVFLSEARVFSTGFQLRWRAIGGLGSGQSLTETLASNGRGCPQISLEANDGWRLPPQPLGGWYRGHPSLQCAGIGGTAQRTDATWWVSPLPEADNVTVAARWSDMDPGLTELVISGVLAAARISAVSLPP